MQKQWGKTVCTLAHGPSSHKAVHGVYTARLVATYGLPLTTRKGVCAENKRTTTRARSNTWKGEMLDALFVWHGQVLSTDVLMAFQA